MTNNISSKYNPTPNNNTEQWNKARENKEKLLTFYNDTIKPTLLDFYNITQEDFKIYLDEQIYPEHNKPIITLRDGLYISYRKWDTDSNPTYSIQLRDMVNTVTGLTHWSDNNIDIQLVKLLVKYWYKIKEYMDTRISICLSDYNNLDSIINKD